jgi:hypothetical protein
MQSGANPTSSIFTYNSIASVVVGYSVFKVGNYIFYSKNTLRWLHVSSPNDGSPNNGSPNDGSPKDGSPNDGSPNDGSPKNLFP